jgi:hypothetical protein
MIWSVRQGGVCGDDRDRLNEAMSLAFFGRRLLGNASPQRAKKRKTGVAIISQSKMTTATTSVRTAGIDAHTHTRTHRPDPRFLVAGVGLTVFRFDTYTHTYSGQAISNTRAAGFVHQIQHRGGGVQRPF